MSKHTHTAGPWRVGHPDSVGVDRRRSVYAGEQSITFVHAIGRMTPEEGEANARLIAAAPTLLAELQNIANANPAEWDEEVRDQFREWAQSRARAAIARATATEPAPAAAGEAE